MLISGPQLFGAIVSCGELLKKKNFAAAKIAHIFDLYAPDVTGSMCPPWRFQ